MFAWRLYTKRDPRKSQTFCSQATPHPWAASINYAYSGSSDWFLFAVPDAVAAAAAAAAAVVVVVVVVTVVVAVVVFVAGVLLLLLLPPLLVSSAG